MNGAGRRLAPVTESVPDSQMIYQFEDFELDTQQLELRHRGEAIGVEPQVFDVLTLLVANRNRVVSKSEIFTEVWGDRIVSESALSSRLKAARRALGDNGTDQRLIKTLHGRGYRFVGEVVERRGGAEAAGARGSATSVDKLPIAPVETETVGREQELSKLFEYLARAQDGFRQLVFVTGEAGLGKTTLVQAFLDGIESLGSVRVLKGNCLEHHGQGEAFLPILEALGRLSRRTEGEELVELLRRRAPSWLIEMPWLVEPGDLVELRRSSRGMTRDRMLREMVEALEELTVETPAVLVLEDLHWSDPSTVDLLTYLANRDEPTRLLVIGTYRATDARAGEHPVAKVVERLKIRSLAAELPLSLLDEDSIRKHLANRLPGADLPEGLPGLLLQRTDGNPLFMETVVNSWIRDGALESIDDSWVLHADLDELCTDVPESLRLLIERRLAELESEDLALLEAASVAGSEFPAAAAAAGAQMPEEEAEDRCAQLARSGNLLEDCEPLRWSDGTVCACYRFVHDVIQEVLYERIPAGRRSRLHHRIGCRLETGLGPEARSSAAELASHFVEGHAIEKAVEYLLLAAHQSLRRFAQVEGIGHLNRGLELLAKLAEDRTRKEIELSYQSALAPAMIAQEGFGSEGAEVAFRRAWELAEELGDHDVHLAMIYGLAIQHELRGNFETSQQLMEERLGLQKQYRNDIALEVENYDLLACSLYHQAGYADSLAISQTGMKAFDERRHSSIASRFGENPGIACFSWAGLNLWFLGSPERAMEFSRQAVALASEPGQEYHLSNAKLQLALLHQLRQEVAETEHWAEATIAQALDQGWVIPVAEGRLLKGWARVKGGDESGFELLQEGLDSLDELGAGMDRPYFLGLMADGLESVGRSDEALSVVDEALSLIHPSRSHFYQSELFRLHGELLLGVDSADRKRAEQWYLRSLELARSQRARSIELRTATSLARLWLHLDRSCEARDLLSGVVGSFEEGHDLPDVVAANRVLQRLDLSTA